MSNKIRPFNIFRNLGLNENQHSNFLLKFISPKGSHNQKDLFIREFLKVVGIDSKIFEKFSIKDISVSTEQKAGNRGRVDLFIEIGDYKIIVENKINGAESTNNQLYRYWKNLIFDKASYRSYFQERKLNGLKESDLNTHIEFYKEKQAEKYKICYLTKSIKSSDSRSYKQSLQRHPFYDSNLYPEKLPTDPIKIGYKEDITVWLNNCLPQIKTNKNCSESDVESIRVIIQQYIQHLQEITK